MARTILKAVCGLLIAIGCCQCGSAPMPSPKAANADPAPAAKSPLREPVLPIADGPGISAAKLELGKRLFHEPALSNPARKISCATCHPLERGGTAGTPPAGTVKGEMEPFDIPTVFNAAQQFAYFWNGRAQSLEAVIQASIRAENVMDGTWDEIIPTLLENSDYRERFERVYPATGLTEATVEDALADFVRSLSTPNAPFDRWLAGEPLSPAAAEGYALFKDLGCVRCHQGSGVGGNLYASFGSYITARDQIRSSDMGRFNVTNDETHRYQFKVPSLRNAALTAPYFHDGSAAELGVAIQAMAQHQAGRTLEDQEVQSLIAFVNALTGTSLSGTAAGAQP